MTDYEIISAYFFENKNNKYLLELHNRYKNLIYSVFKKYSFLNNVYEFEDFSQDSFLILIDAINYYYKENNEKYSFGILFKWLLNNHCKYVYNQVYKKIPDELPTYIQSNSEYMIKKIEIDTIIDSIYNDEESKKNIITDLKYFNKNEVCKHHKITYYQLNKVLFPLKKSLA